MRSVTSKLGCLIVIVSWLLVLAGCIGASEPSRFFVLRPLPATGEPAAGGDAIAIGVGPVVFPAYLDRPEMVTQISDNELDVDEFHRWAEPLKDNFTGVLAENLSVLVATDRVAVFPWTRATPIDYQVTVQVTRFLGEVGGANTLTARWRIFKGDGKELLVTRQSSFTVDAISDDIAAMVEAQSRALEELSTAIAAELRRISSRSAT